MNASTLAGVCFNLIFRLHHNRSILFPSAYDDSSFQWKIVSLGRKHMQFYCHLNTNLGKLKISRAHLHVEDIHGSTIMGAAHTLYAANHHPQCSGEECMCVVSGLINPGGPQ